MHVLLYAVSGKFLETWSCCQASLYDPLSRRPAWPLYLGGGGGGGVESPSTWIFGTGSCYSAEYFSRKDTGMERALRSHWFIQSLTNHTCTDCRPHLRIGLKSRTHGHILVESFIGVIQNYMNCEVYVLGRFTYMYMLIYIYGHQMVHMNWGRMHLWGVLLDV